MSKRDGLLVRPRTVPAVCPPASVCCIVFGVSRTAYLIIDSSERNSDLFHRTGFFVPDPVIFFEHDGEGILVLSDLELERGKKEAKVERVVSLRECAGSARGGGKKRPGMAEIAAALLRERGIRSLIVQRNFPVFYADALRTAGFFVRTAKTDFLFPGRLRKSPAEVSHIKKALSATAEAMRLAVSLVSDSVVKNSMLYYEGRLLTSEIVRSAVNSHLAARGYLASNTIVAGGVQGSMPHETGSGPLVAGWPVVIDIFPRSQRNGYFGDMTRTVVKGEPSAELSGMYDTVLRGQKIGLSMIRDGVRSKDVHGAIMDFFTECGFQTAVSGSGNPEGFIHSTGHGLGLDIHEPPRIGPGKEILREGNVVTVEPGLYYERLGGIRIEDVVLVTRDGNENLTRCSKRFRV